MNCNRCRWANKSEKLNCIGYVGPKDASLVFIGEAYGGTEVSEIEGIAGDQMLRLLKGAGIDWTKVALMNSVRCYQYGNSSPTRKELDACFFNTYKNLREIKPDLVIAMGTAAIYLTTGLDGAERNRGKLVESKKLGGMKVFCTFLPSSVKYDGDKYNLIKTDFKNLQSALTDKPFEIYHYPYEYVDTYDKMEKAYADLQGKEINFDVEAQGLNPYKDNVTLVQLSASPDKIYVVDMRVIDGRSLVIDMLRELLENNPIVGQGWDFDARMIAVQYKIFPKNWEFDSCLAEYVLTGMKANDLDFLTDKYAPESSGYSAEVKKAGGAHRVMDKAKLLQYGANDVGVLHPIKRKQRRALLKRKSMWDNGYTADWCYRNLTLPCNKVLTKMSLAGLHYDIEKLKIIDEKYAKKARRSLMKAQALECVDATQRHFRQIFNPRSSTHIKWMMLEYFKLPVLAKTTHDNPSVGKDEMKIYAEEHNNAYARIMEKYRSIQGIRDNFLGGVMDKLEGNIAHPNYSLHGTASGRPIAKNPNVLNIPDIDEIRECIIARPGYVFVYSDLSQIEVRQASVIYNEPKLIEYCNTEGKDFHCLTTSNMFGIDYEEVLKWYTEYENGSKDPKAVKMHHNRSVAKTITFGILYQMGAEKLSYRLGITEKQAKAFIEDYFRSFPDLRKNIENVKNFVNKYGFIDTWFGFRRQWQYYGKKEHQTQREAVNHPIQGTAWNVMEKILVKTDDFLDPFESYLCWQNYDSLAIMTKENEVDDIAPEVKQIMETVQAKIPVLNRVKIKADIKIGYDLGHFTKLL